MLRTSQQHDWRAYAVEQLELYNTRLDKWVLAGIILERFLTRFFSEKLALLPGWTNFLDYPILILFAAYVLVTSKYRRQLKTKSGFGMLTLALVTNIAISAMLNLSRLHPGAFFLFIVGFLEPLAYMLLAYTLAPRRETAEFLVKVLFFVGWLQIIVVVFMDFPAFLAERDPDVISGSFGENAYQLVFFLMAWNVLILSSSPSGRYKVLWIVGIVVLQGLILSIILLAQFRAFIPFAAITWGISSFLVTRRRSQALVTGLVGVGIFLVFFVVINSLFPELKYQEFFQLSQRTDEIEGAGKVQAVLNFGELISVQPKILVFGAGPGTYASRGFRTFSIVGRGDVANELYREFFNTDYYVTDLAARYVLPTASLTAFGASTTATPWFSYLALPAELGLPGLFIILSIYFLAIRKSWNATYLGAPTVSLARWVIVAMLLLLQMAFLENWLETSRLTVPVWTIFGVVLAQLHKTEETQLVAENIPSYPFFKKISRRDQQGI